MSIGATRTGRLFAALSAAVVGAAAACGGEAPPAPQ
jgi:hypothetical protein